MSPEGLAAASRRIELRMVDARKKFAHEYGRVANEHAARGMGRSSAIVLAVHRLCDEEFQRRANMAWNTVREVLDSEGWVPTDHNGQQIRSLIEEAVVTRSGDAHEYYRTACSWMPESNWPALEDSQRHALDSALADAEIDLLGRQARRPPLVDELSAPRYQPACEHWRKAISLSTKEPPDLPNALKEAASAVESAAQIVLGKPGITLGDAVKELRSAKRIPVGADKVLDGLYAFANDSPGARHGSALAAHVDPSHWAFARTTAEGAIRLLLDIDTA